MSFNTISVLLLIGVFSGMLLSLIIGQRLGRREKDVGTDSGRIQLTAVEAAIFGLMGLMIAFTFSGAAQRYETAPAARRRRSECHWHILFAHRSSAGCPTSRAA